MERCVVASSYKKEMEAAFREVSTVLDSTGKEPILIIFTSGEEDFYYYARELKNKYPNATSIGSSTYLNIDSKGFSHDGFSAMAIYDGIECSANLIYQISTHPSNYRAHIKNAMNKMSSLENSCCFILSTALTNGEELVLDTFKRIIGDKNIPLFGSSAGSSSVDKRTLVALNGDIYVDTCAFVFIRNLRGRITFLKENIYKETDFHFNVTDVDVDERKVYEYDGQPAAKVMSDVLNVELRELAEKLDERPIGRIVDNEIFITDVNKVDNDGSISYFATLYNHTPVALLELADVDEVWNHTIDSIKAEIPNPSFGIVINCLARTKMFEREKWLDKFGDVLKQTCNKYIGVAGYGEQLNFQHLNRSLVLAVFE